MSKSAFVTHRIYKIRFESHPWWWAPLYFGATDDEAARKQARRIAASGESGRGALVLTCDGRMISRFDPASAAAASPVLGRRPSTATA